VLKERVDRNSSANRQQAYCLEKSAPLKHVLRILAFLLLCASLIPFLPAQVWWVRIFDFPRSQLFGLGIVLLVAYLWRWRKRLLSTRVDYPLIASLFLSLVLQGYQIFPYTTFAPYQVLSAPVQWHTDAAKRATVSFVVANVLMTNHNAGALIKLIDQKQPDIVLALEPDAFWESKLRPLERGYPYTLKEPTPNLYGMLLYSRLPIVDGEIKHLVHASIPSFHGKFRLRSGNLVRFHAVHPEPPSPTEASTSTPRDAELLMVGQAVAEHRASTIVMGDLNDVAWSHTTRLFQRISRLLDPRRGRGMFNTFHAQIPLARWPLDHIFHSDDFVLAHIERLGDIGSDHFPMYVKLMYKPKVKARQEAPQPMPDDHEEAEEKREKVPQRDSL